MEGFEGEEVYFVSFKMFDFKRVSKEESRQKNHKKKYAVNGCVCMVPTDEILPNPLQPRRDFSYEKLLNLAQSISENGLVQPITIAFREGQPVVIAGERRLRAAKIAGVKQVPCVEMSVSEQQGAVMSLIENLQREDLNFFEAAEGIQRLISDYEITQERAAEQLGCSQSTVANRLRLLRLPQEERRLILDHGLSERHARALLRIEEQQPRRDLMVRIIRDKLTVVQAERAVEELLQGAVKRKRPTVPLIKDVRLFLNTVNHAVDTMRRSGIRASAEKTETDDYIEYVVRIPKSEAVTEIAQNR